MSISVCVPSRSLSENCSNLDQLTQSIYQIARALVSFNACEIIVQGDSSDQSTIITAALLQYFITPPYLVSATFENVSLPPNVFSKAKKLPSIPNLPCFSNTRYKEGLSVDKNPKNWSKLHPEFVSKSTTGRVKPLPKAAKTTRFVQIGREECIEVKEDLNLNQRVCIDLETKSVVGSYEIAYGWKSALNIYGYQVRIANKLIDAWTDTPIPNGYDKSLFVKGGDYHNEGKCALRTAEVKQSNSKLLLVVGKWHNLEKLFDECGMEGVKVEELFDGQVSVPNGLRVEDSVLVALSRV